MNLSAEIFQPHVVEKGENAEITVKLDGVRCVACLNAIERRVGQIKGIRDITLNLTQKQAGFLWNRKETDFKEILSAIYQAGFKAEPLRTSTDEISREKSYGNDLKKLVIAIFFTMNLMLISVSLWAGLFSGMSQRFLDLFRFLSFVFSTPVVFYAGSGFIRGAFFSVKNKCLNMDFQIAFNSMLIYFYSIYLMLSGSPEVYFESAAMFVTFILISKYFEAAALKRMRSFLKSLQLRYPKFGRLIGENGQSKMIPIQEIKKGMELELLPGDAVPADGFISAGEADIDESALTGEYLPNAGKKGDKIFSGAFVIDGKIRFLVEKTPKNSTLSKLSEMLEKAMGEKTERKVALSFFTRHFTNLIAFLAMATFSGWYILSGDFDKALLNAAAVFIIACPCALALAIPLSNLSGFRLAFQNRVLMKSAKNFNRLSEITDIIFDKTGTLTEGKPEVADVFSQSDDFDEELFNLVSVSNHPVSKAVKEYLLTRDNSGFSAKLDLSDLNEIPGKGLRAKINGRIFISGNFRLLEENQCVFSEAAEDYMKENHDQSLLYCAVDGEIIKIFTVRDKLRPEAAEVVKKLMKSGFRVHLCSGDSSGSVKNFIKKTELFQETWNAEMLPSGKKDYVKQIQEKGGGVLFLGDGLNDSPAMAIADLSISMNGGIDLAIESADLILQENKLGVLPKLFKISEKVLRLIRMNLTLSVLYNLSLIPLAVLGFVSPPVAAGAMALSSLIVVGNSLRPLKL